MEIFPEEIFTLIGQFLTIRDVISLTISNSRIREMFLSPRVNYHLANYFGFPYGLTLEELQKYENMSFNDRLVAATVIGDRRIIDKVIEFGADDFNHVLIEAVNKGDFGLVKLFVQKGASTLSMAMIGAAKFNHPHIIEFLFQQGSKNLKRPADIAAQNGSIDALKKLFELNAEMKENSLQNINTSSVIAQAVKGNQIEVAKWLIEEGISTPNLGLLFATRFGRMEIIVMMIEYGASNISMVIPEAYKHGHISIAQYLEDFIDTSN